VTVATVVAVRRLLLRRPWDRGSAFEPAAPPVWPPFSDSDATGLTSEALEPEDSVASDANSRQLASESTDAAGSDASSPDVASDPTDVGPLTDEAAEARWVPPVEKLCPEGFPIKAKVSSGVYHAPGGAMYDRTTPDRCYASREDAERDGFRSSKR
jgi:hypothetical protein